MALPAPPPQATQALKVVLDEGIARDLFYAMSCDAVLRVVGSHAAAINAARYGNLFGLLQRFLVDEMTLSVARTFDRSGGRNNTRSLAELVRLLRAHNFPIVEPSAAVDALSRQGVLGVERDEHKLRAAVLARLEALLAESEPLLTVVVERRDTLLAHHDVKARARDDLPLLREDVLQLFRLATDVLELTCLPLLRIAHVVGGRFLLQSDARSGGVELLALLRRAGVVPPDWIPPANLWHEE